MEASIFVFEFRMLEWRDSRKTSVCCFRTLNVSISTLNVNILKPLTEKRRNEPTGVELSRIFASL